MTGQRASDGLTHHLAAGLPETLDGAPITVDPIDGALVIRPQAPTGGALALNPRRPAVNPTANVEMPSSADNALR